MKRIRVTLSDGTRVPVTLGAPQRLWYPDLPHCWVCDEVQGRALPMFLCDAFVPGKTAGPCGRYLCAQHRVRHGRDDLCPAHAAKGAPL